MASTPPGRSGGLAHRRPRSPQEQFTDRERQLLADIAGQAGAAAYSDRLTTALQRSRERLVLAGEEERRRIRRDLHDGLGPTLASQTFKLDDQPFLMMKYVSGGSLADHLRQEPLSLTEIRRILHISINRPVVTKVC